MIRVMIADDHELIRDGLKWLINKHPDMDIVCEASTSRDIIPQLKRHDVDVLLLDITMPGGAFLDTMSRISVETPRVKVLVQSVHPEEQYALRALDAGAKGYLNKQHSSDNLASAIQQVHNGGKYITTALAELLVEERNRDGLKPAHTRLTSREYEILCLLGSGKRIADIAADLSLSPKTVSTHQANILKKMKFRGVGDLIRYTLEYKLVL